MVPNSVSFASYFCLILLPANTDKPMKFITTDKHVDPRDNLIKKTKTKNKNKTPNPGGRGAAAGTLDGSARQLGHGVRNMAP